MRLRAPAKINLALRVGPLRSDGYHRIATVFQAIDLFDEIELERADETSVEGFPDDTLVRGALELLGQTRRVRLTKRIPVSAGLGGGSSDAGAVLRGLAGRHDTNELYAMARALGSDVPFFLSGLESAYAEGRGDRLKPLPDLPRGYGLVLVPSSDGLSAGEVYAATEPNPLFDAVRGDLVRAMHTARDAGGIARLVVNDLEPAVVRLRPQVAGVLDELRGRGALAAAVSGSGPTVFAVVGDRAAAERLAAEIPGAVPAAPL